MKAADMEYVQEGDMMTQEAPKDLMSLTDIGRELGLKYTTLRYWQNQGWISSWRLGGKRGLSSLEEVRKFATTPERERKADE
jgi:predicted site-specific integrase-resolvase